MLTDTDIDRATLTLVASGLRAPDAWAEPHVRALGLALWLELLGGLTSRQLDAAVLAHMNHPERGRFWPTPADLLSAAGATAPPKIEDQDAAAWDRILRNPRGQSIRGLVDDVQFAAMQAMNGPYDAQNTSDPIRLASLRRQFLDGCKARRNPPVKVLEGGKAAQALPENVRQFIGGKR